jgi:hypothetical protein
LPAFAGFFGLKDLSDLFGRHAALQHGHALVGLEALRVGLADDVCDSDDGQPDKDGDWNYVRTYPKHDVPSFSCPR